MTNLTGRRCWLTLDIRTLIQQKYKAKKDYQICKKTYLKVRATHLEKISIDMADKGNTREESRLHALLKMEKSRDRSRQLRTLKPIFKGAGVNRLSI